MQIETYGSYFAAVDFELTGGEIGIDAPVQFGCAIFDASLRFTGQTFNERIRPTRPVNDRAAAIHGLTTEVLATAPPDDLVADQFGEWVEWLAIPHGKRLIAVAHNWPVECVTLYQWLGQRRVHDIFGFVARDTMTLAASLRDAGLPIKSVALPALCRQFGIVYDNPHDALADAIATGEVYEKLLRKINV